ncbi:MAG: hypothetical protein KA297_30115 [Kofleriaceae bacterium]|jgi:hypothetical protein|nr:hypothetical protein [Kofleriaceae bacterium]MBP6836351.1 hypothetical protein [Kofleriaceae bacterium]
MKHVITSWLAFSILSVVGAGGGASCADTIPSEIGRDRGGADAGAFTLVILWPPRLCGQAERVVVELEERSGRSRQVGVPCVLDRLDLTVEQLGSYWVRARALTDGPAPRVVACAHAPLVIDGPGVVWRPELTPSTGPC